MRILTTLTVSGGLNLASNAKDTFIIGTPLENNDGLVDKLDVYANADFKNNVTIGNNSIDTLLINAKTTASQDLLLNNASLIISGSGTVYYNGMDVFASMGGDNSQGTSNQNDGNSLNQINYYPTIIVSSSTQLDVSSSYERYYSNYDYTKQSIIINLPNASNELLKHRIFTFWNISSYYEMSGTTQITPYSTAIVPQQGQLIYTIDPYLISSASSWSIGNGQRMSLQSIIISGSYQWLITDSKM